MIMPDSFEDEDEDEVFDLEKLSPQEIAELRRKIQAGVDAMRQGRFTTCRTKEDLQKLADEIIQKGMKRRNLRMGNFAQ